MIEPGGSFGDYRVMRRLGKGGMGEVWLLESVSGALVAAKILDPDTAADHKSRKRFLREAELALGVKHPNLVETYDVGEDPDTGLCYILMEYVPGGTLADYIKTNGAMAIDDAVAVVEAMAGVLELGRQKGIVHRDIKPANIMFAADGTPKLADLGIARAGNGAETTVTRAGAMIGTPAYMSPEQMLDAHNVDTRADIYSLGVVFFEMLTGERPNKDDTVVQLMAKAMRGEPLPDVRTLRPEVSASLAQLLNMMVAPNKDGRISTPGQITNALAIIERGGNLNKPDAESVRTKREEKRKVRPLRWPTNAQARRYLVFLKWMIPLCLLAGLAVAFVHFGNRAKVGERGKHVLNQVELDAALRGVEIKISPACARHANTIKNWVCETVDELRRQLGPAYDEVRDRSIAEVLVCAKGEVPPTDGGLQWLTDSVRIGLSHNPKDHGKTRFSMCFSRGLEGDVPDEDAHGDFVLGLAFWACGLHAGCARAEPYSIAWALMDSMGLSVARRLGYGDAADRWLRLIESRKYRVVLDRNGLKDEDVTLEGTLRPGAKPNHNGALVGYCAWVVEYRIAKLINGLMRDNPDILRDYFRLRNKFRKSPKCQNGVVTAEDFTRLMSKAAGRDLSRVLNPIAVAKPKSEQEKDDRQIAALKVVAAAEMEKVDVRGLPVYVSKRLSPERREIALNIIRETMEECHRVAGDFMDEVLRAAKPSVGVCGPGECYVDSPYKYKSADGYARGGNTLLFELLDTWVGYGDSARRGSFVHALAEDVIGLQAYGVRRENIFVSYGLQASFANVVAENLGHRVAVEKRFAELQKRYDDWVRNREKTCGPLSLEGEFARDVGNNARMFAVWGIELRVARAVAQFEKESPGTLKRYFEIRQERRRDLPGDKDRIETSAFLEMMSKAVGRDVTKDLSEAVR